MKRALLLPALFLLAGCAAPRAKLKPTGMGIPVKCITGAFPNRAKCSIIGKDLAVCDGMLVTFACLEAIK